MTDSTGGSKPSSGKGKSEGSKPKGATDIKGWALKTVAAIIGGLGVAGAMVVIGSGVLWVRFQEVGMPATLAVSLQSRHEAIAQGAQTTLIFVLIALAAVGVLYVVDGIDLDAKAKEKVRGGESSDSTEPTVQADPHPIGHRATLALCLMATCGVVWALFGPEDLSSMARIEIIALAVALTFGCVWIGRNESKNFWALAAVAFVSVIAFAAVSGYLIVKDQKFIQAVAVVKGDKDHGITGFYVTTDGEYLYVATSAGPGAGRPKDKAVQRIKLGDTVRYLVGPLETVYRAERTAGALLDQLRSPGGGESAVDLPSWVPTDVLDTFTDDVTPYEKVTDKPLCLMRFADKKQVDPRRRYWTSCAAAEAMKTIQEARERLALPSRFQKEYVVRVKVELPVGTRLRYLEGGTAPQCGGDAKEPCGHRYSGGGLQYWLEDPTAAMELKDLKYECTKTDPDRQTVWKRGKCK
jgi:hypothetical protein